jgi:predicted nucleotidyltransferase
MTTWTLETLRQNKAAIERIAHRWGARNVRIFGSVARGEAQAGSDVDLLVELEPGRSLIDLGGFIADVEEILGCRVDVVSERGLRPRFRDRVLHEAVPL